MLIVYFFLQLKCSAKGNTKAQYRWMKDGRFVSNWNDFGDYVIEQVTEEDQGGYSCLASSSAGLIQSSVAYMTVNGEKSFLVAFVTSCNPPPPTSKSEFSSRSPYVCSSVSSENLVVHKDNTSFILNSCLLSKVLVTGINVHCSTDRDANQYRSVWRAKPNARNAPHRYLAALILSYVIDPPTIVTHPSNSSVELGGEVTLACNASGDPQPTFRWYKDSIPMVEANDINPFLPELVLKDAIAPDEAWYFCEATNVAGKVRSNLASLKVFGE